MKTILSGITPTGKLHLGNYFGAIRQHIRMQEKGDAFYFIANYHSLTSISDGDQVRQNSYDIALDYLALGLDPEKCTFFLQSDVPQVTELAWILGSLCPVSLMEKGVAYKEKVAQGLNPNIGLFTYPILQAADILIYNSDLVPVGQDQKQNIEICRDLAGKFNHAYDGEYLKLPEEYIVEEVAVVPGIDGRKMSKSYNNTIGIFDEGKTLKKKVMSIETDSTPLEDPKDPDTCNVFALIRLFADEDTRNEIAAKYREGGYGYGDAKKVLLNLIDEHFAEARERRKNLEQQMDKVVDLLKQGGRKARERAETVMEPVRSAAGIIRNLKVQV
ncbi:MAG: tryptophan--tRNA ligase [Balneolaceae bacterium]|nr:tryptophan--tRNA ligase [Balneolaceae bacterium]